MVRTAGGRTPRLHSVTSLHQTAHVVVQRTLRAALRKIIPDSDLHLFVLRRVAKESLARSLDPPSHPWVISFSDPRLNLLCRSAFIAPASRRVRTTEPLRLDLARAQIRRAIAADRIVVDGRV